VKRADTEMNYMVCRK